MIKLIKYIAIVFIFVLNAQACEKEKTIEKRSEAAIIIENLYNACKVLENFPVLPTHTELLSYIPVANDFAKKKIIFPYYSWILSQKESRKDVNRKLGLHDPYYEKPFFTITQQLIRNKAENTINKMESITGFNNYTYGLFSNKMLVFPFALEYCIQNKYILEKANFNKKQLKQEITSLENEPNNPKPNLSPSDYIKYHMIKSEINYITAQENLEYAAVDLAMFMKEKYKENYKEHKLYYDLAEKTQLFLDQPKEQQSIEEAQDLIDTAKSLPNPKYAVFCTKNEDNTYGLTQVHNLLVKYTK